jgi:hypothetical protein
MVWYMVAVEGSFVSFMLTWYEKAAKDEQRQCGSWVSQSRKRSVCPRNVFFRRMSCPSNIHDERMILQTWWGIRFGERTPRHHDRARSSKNLRNLRSQHIWSHMHLFQRTGALWSCSTQCWSWGSSFVCRCGRFILFRDGVLSQC